MTREERLLVTRLVDAAQSLANGMMEDHNEELATNHFGDGKRSCSYCRDAGIISRTSEKLMPMLRSARKATPRRTQRTVEELLFATEAIVGLGTLPVPTFKRRRLRLAAARVRETLFPKKED